MTLILALACKDGIVFASDSLTTMPVAKDLFTNENIYFKDKITKIKELGDNKNKLWAASGNFGIIQQFEQSLVLLQQKHPNFSFSDEVVMNKLQDGFADILRHANRIHKRVNDLPEAEMPETEPPSAQVLIVGCECTEKDENVLARIFHLDTNGQSMFWEKDFGYKAIGFDFFALAEPMLRQFKTVKYDIQLGCFIAYKVLADSIAHSTVIGESIDIWTINNNGSHQLGIYELVNLEKTYQWWPDVAKEYFETKVVEKLNSFSASELHS
ncbi:MAG TPA: hypothetical protein VEG44_00260 [Candidatus Acidoferrales bacterium]|nr:hypothetical protein [Candidatus Acidoferrales bacterium]